MTKTSRRKYILAGIAVFLLVATVWAYYNVQRGTIRAQYLYFSTLESLCEQADIIVVCDVESAGNQTLINISKGGIDLAPYTVSTVNVIETLKGNIQAGDSVEVKQMGFYKSLPDSETKQIDGYLKKGSRYILFLSTYDDLGLDVPCSPLNPRQGVVPIDENGYVAGNDALFIDEPLDSTIEKIQGALLNNSN